MIYEGPLGRIEPPNMNHVELYPFRLLAPLAVTRVEKILPIRAKFRPYYDQGVEGACVGFGLSWMMSILNNRKYAARWLYKEAQKVDGIDGENYEGTYTYAGFDVMKNRGHRRIWGWITQPEFLAHGIEAYRWATSVDDIRTSIALRSPIAMGIAWHTAFDNPTLRKENDHYWIGQDSNIGPIRGYHLICCRGASDKRQAFLWTNSWGLNYPDVWIPYSVVEKLLHVENGEAGIVTDR